MIYVLGGNGFIGSAFVRLLERLNLDYRVIHRENYDALRNSACDVLVNANGNSSKVLAKRTPLDDFDRSVRSVAESLEAFRAGTYVFLSTGDVYPDPSTPKTTGEDEPIDPRRLGRYGLHKYLAEQLVQASHPQWLTFRLSGFVGHGLKKNAIFDMLHDDVVWLNPESRLQYVDVDHAAQMMWTIIEKGVRNQVVNIGARGVVELAEVYGRIGSKSLVQPEAPRIRYELSVDKVEKLLERPIPTSAAEVYGFVDDAPRCCGT